MHGWQMLGYWWECFGIRDICPVMSVQFAMWRQNSNSTLVLQEQHSTIMEGGSSKICTNPVIMDEI